MKIVRVVKNLSVAALAVFLAGCDEVKFDGQLDVSEQIVFTQDSRALTPGENANSPVLVTVAPGRFSARATIGKSGSKKRIKLEIADAVEPSVVKILFDKDINTDGSFTLTAAQTGQGFDIAGRVDTKVEASPEYSGTEYCTYKYPQTVCRSGSRSGNEESAFSLLKAELAEYTPPSAGPEVPSVSAPEFHQSGNATVGQFKNPPPQTCYTTWVDRPGTMYVRYYYETTLRDLRADFVQADKTLAVYAGKASGSRKVYTYRSSCR